MEQLSGQSRVHAVRHFMAVHHPEMKDTPARLNPVPDYSITRSVSPKR
ncbi:MAG: hypothetical protein NT072_00280 [Deltaproteobacteria bacterium]|nr:hypothetical protein [Deltaproteobacteria bacterium]